MFYNFEDDICFCFDSENCNHTDCWRHDSNIKYKDVPHSYSYFKNTEYCQYSNPISEERLEHYKEYFNHQPGQEYPSSNQVVTCAIITNDRFKAKSIMEKKGADIVSETSNLIIWKIKDGETWTWRKSYENCCGYRFYKVIIDKYTDKDIFEKILLPCCANYCCSMEII